MFSLLFLPGSELKLVPFYPTASNKLFHPNKGFRGKILTNMTGFDPAKHLNKMIKKAPTETEDAHHTYLPTYSTHPGLAFQTYAYMQTPVPPLWKPHLAEISQCSTSRSLSPIHFVLS